MSDVPEIQRIHVPLPPEQSNPPDHSYYDFRAEAGDSVSAYRDSDGTWRWQLIGVNGKLKLEAGNFENSADAILAAHDIHGDTPTYSQEAE